MSTSTAATAAHAPFVLPTVTLDTTLADLYRKCPSLKDKYIGQVLSCFSSAMPLTRGIPRNRKYIYQDAPFTSGDITPESGAETAIKYLSLIPQRDAFISGGDSSSIFFHISFEDGNRQDHDRREAEKTLEVLAKSQRPDLVFCDGPGSIPIEESGIDIIACKAVLDGLQACPHVVPWEKHWFLNSKGALAASGLPTPRCEAVAVHGVPPGTENCCDHCAGLDTDDYVISDNCLGARLRWRAEQSQVLMAELESRPLPFVLKNQQTFGGAGTYFVRSEAERQRTVELFRGGFLCRLLSTVNISNAHLQPATLLFSDVVPDPECIYLGACQQVIDDGTSWVGSTINYRDQDVLRAKFEPLVRRVSAWLQSHGYLGPAGADVLETADGQIHVVDLNIRTTGSLCLPLMRTHFVEHGLGWASSLSVKLKWRRADFVHAFANEFHESRICVLSWYEDEESGESLADIVIGGSNKTELQVLSDRIRGPSGTATF